MSRYRPPKVNSAPYITAEGAKGLRSELYDLWKIERPKVTQIVHEAAKNGDLLAMLAPSWYGQYVFKAGYEYPAETLGLALPPVWPGEERYTGAWGGGEFGGYKGTKNPQLVADMLVWLTTNEDNTQHAVTFPAYKPASISWGAQVSADTFYAEDIFCIQ